MASIGPVWELPNGVQLRLDYRAVSLLMELLKAGKGNCFLNQRQGDSRKGTVTHGRALYVM